MRRHLKLDCIKFKPNSIGMVLTTKNTFFLLLLSLLLAVNFGFVGKPAQPKNSSIEFFVREYQKDFHPNHSFMELIFVSIKNQQLFVIKGGKVSAKYAISTSEYGVGSKMYSQKTPIGLHQVKFKIGAGAPVNGIIKTGYYTGKKAEVSQDTVHTNDDLITTRVLWLDGLEPGLNKGGKVDTYSRSIYIHGTPEEGLIGQPASHGCVRMKNLDVLQLFNSVDKGALVLILDH